MHLIVEGAVETLDLFTKRKSLLDRVLKGDLEGLRLYFIVPRVVVLSFML